MNAVLLAARRNKGLTRRKAAFQIGVSRGVLERAESGLGVHPHHAKRIADFYALQVTDIWPIEEKAA